MARRLPDLPPFRFAQWRGPDTRLGTLAVAMMLVLAAMLGLSSWLTSRANSEEQSAAGWRVHTFQVLDHTARLRIAALQTVRGERGYLLTLDEQYLEPFTEGHAIIGGSLDKLRSLVTESKSQTEQLDLIEARLDYHQSVLGAMIDLTKAGKHDQALARMREGEGRLSTEAVMNALDVFEAQERALLDVRTSRAKEVAAHSAQFEKLLVVVGFFLLLLGSLAAAGLRRSLIREEASAKELRRFAMTDELTGLANRREVLATLNRMISASRCNGKPLSLAILDIDRFKRVNDTYGHPAGDEVIKTVARLAASIMREGDLVGRLGGEEFVFAFPDTDAFAAANACDRLRKQIAAMPIIVEGDHVLSITLSSGVAELGGVDDRTSLIARADAALYIAKEGGRDQVRLAA